MSVSSELIAELVKATNDTQPAVEETTVYGTIVEYNGSAYVRLDGSELLTPITTTAVVRNGERVTVMIKNHTAIVTGNVTSPSAQAKDVDKVLEATDRIAEFELIVAYRVTADEISSINATIERLRAVVADFGDVTAVNAEIERLQAEYADLDYVYAEHVESLNARIENIQAMFGDFADVSAENLEAANAEIDNLRAYNADFTYVSADVLKAMKARIDALYVENLEATYAKLQELDATIAHINELEAEMITTQELESDVADIGVLMFGSAGGDVIQTSFSNAVIAQLGDAQIKSAMIENITADKIVSGDVITNNVRVMSEDGKLLISDETIQISDSNRVRVQIGKDSSNDYSINIWDANGSLMFSKGGITSSAIKDAIIRNDMISDAANISAHKLDIDSLFKEINDSTNSIKATRIYLDGKNQTLNVAFKELETEVGELGGSVSSQGTQLSVMKGKIDSKVWQQDIDNAADAMSTQYSTLEQELGGISATVSEHSTQIESAQSAADTAQNTANQNAADMARIVTKFDSDIGSLQTQIDGSITTWFFEVPPTSANEPAVNWNTADLRNTHLGDLYYDTITGYCYRWQVQNNTYSWQRITDTDVTKALSDAKSAQDTADQKRRVFYSQPAPPYDAGDLWVQGSGGDILRCKNAKVNGQSYSISDWDTASKYTDDTVANTANSNALAAQTAAAKAQNDIDTLNVGGRNLLLNSAAVLLNMSDTGNNNVSVLENDYVKFYPVNDGNIYNNSGGITTAVTRKKGVEYTLSFEILTPTRIGFYWYPSEHYSKTGSIQASESWQKYVFTYTQTGEDSTGNTLFGFNDLTAGEVYCYRNLKLEVGNRATDWTPAPEDIESKIETLNERIITAESKITQNADAIRMTVTRSEVANTYATKTELSTAQNEANTKYASKTELSSTKSELTSEIELKKNSILSTVSSNYATKTALTEAASSMNTTVEQTKNSILSSVSSTYATKSALTKTENAVNNLQIGGRNLFKGYDEREIQLNDYQGTGSFTQFIGNLTFDPSETVGETYTISFWAKSPNGSTPLSIYNQNGEPRYFYFPRTLMTSNLGDKWEYFTHTLTNADMGESYTGTYNNRIEFYASGQLGVLVKKIKVELGNKATDWTPAPEDMASADDTSLAQSIAESAQETASRSETLIQQLSESISMLVTDGNGTSLMTQTESGWTFSTADIQAAVAETAESLSSLTDEVGDTNHTVDVLRQAVADLGEIAEYVKIGTYENEPCIEMGEGDSEFKLRITNTRILFMEGSSVIAHFTNQSLHIKKAVIEEELQQGEFVWKARANGNLGLIWKGVSS